MAAQAPACCGHPTQTMDKLPMIIQGGMGVAISTWRLANTVSRQGHLGVVSGTGIGIVMIARLMDGDTDGSVRRALHHFPHQEMVERLLKRYYIPGGKPEDAPYKRPVMWTTRPPRELNALTVIGNFVEVWLAKEGHDNPVGINLLEKVQMPNMASLYGAMLAGVDYVIIGAGIPMQIPGILDELAEHRPTSYLLDVHGAGPDDDYRVHFNPEEVFPGLAATVGPLKRPRFFPIVSSFVLAQALLKRASGRIDGFVVELPTAGGHNAPPRGAMQLNERGEPIYGPKDAVDLDKIKGLGLPFWLAGGYATPEGLEQALAAGAQGIQVGTAFAYCDESGFDPVAREYLLAKALEGEGKVRTDPRASPTGFPFKVVELEGSLSEAEVLEARPRLCDIGYLRHLYKREDDTLGYRCPAEPVDQYVAKGGTEEETEGRVCLCNALGSAAGFRQVRSSGYVEQPIITSGDDYVHIGRYLKPGQTHYSAADVIEYLTQRVAVG